MTSTVTRTVGDGTVWPPEAVHTQVDEDTVIIYDAADTAAHVRSDVSVPLEDVA